MGRCGIYEYSQILLEGFQQAGYKARYIGVRNKDGRDLRQKLSQVTAEDALVIFEYEPGIFELRSLVVQMVRLRLLGKRAYISVHEIEPAKYGEYHYIIERLSQPARFKGGLELLRLLWATLCVGYRYFTLRLFLSLLGWFPQQVIVHSAMARDHLGLLLSDSRKVLYVPHLVKQLEGDRSLLRQQLGLPQEVFAFIIPGFLFRRKRIIEVIEQLPAGVELWVVGTSSAYEPDYLVEIEAYVASNGKSAQVRLIQDYDRMEQYLMAADAAVFYYSAGYQSGAASLAVGAGKPCIFSDLPAFEDLQEAGIKVHTPNELREALIQIQEEPVYKRLVKQVTDLRQRLAPAQIARAYMSEAVDKRG